MRLGIDSACLLWGPFYTYHIYDVVLLCNCNCIFIFFRFTVKLGNRVPEFQEMWAKSKDNKMASTNQLSNTIYVGGMSQLRFEAAANMSMDEGDTLHYKLRLSLVPPNIDVWGWVKYYR